MIVIMIIFGGFPLSFQCECFYPSKSSVQNYSSLLLSYMNVKKNSFNSRKFQHCGAESDWKRSGFTPLLNLCNEYNDSTTSTNFITGSLLHVPIVSFCFECMQYIWRLFLSWDESMVIPSFFCVVKFTVKLHGEGCNRTTLLRMPN